MFTWLNKQGVQSDRGFDVQRTERFVMEYHEKGNIVSEAVTDESANWLVHRSVNIRARAA